MIGSMQQKLLFFILLCSPLQAKQFSLHQYLHLMRENQENQPKLDDDEKLFQDLGQVASDFYKKIIETTMLYFTGMITSSDQFHKQLLLETNKHLLYASQLFTQYIAKLLKNPKVSWKVKIKRCAYITSFLVVLIILMKEYHQAPNTPPTAQTIPSISNPYLSVPNLQHESVPQHRERPPLN